MPICHIYAAMHRTFARCGATAGRSRIYALILSRQLETIKIGRAMLTPFRSLGNLPQA